MYFECFPTAAAKYSCQTSSLRDKKTCLNRKKTFAFPTLNYNEGHGHVLASDADIFSFTSTLSVFPNSPSPGK